MRDLQKCKKKIFFNWGISLFHLRSKQKGDIPLVYHPPSPHLYTHKERKAADTPQHQLHFK